MRLVLCCVAGVAAAASAQSVEFNPNIENFGGSDPNGNGIGDPELIFSATFDLPAILSIDSVSFEFAHSFLSDMHMTLESPGGDLFFLAKGRSSPADPPFDAPFDGGNLGDGGSLLVGAEMYSFASAGDVWNDGDGGTSPAPGGTFAAVEWFGGPFGGGEWEIQVWDAWDTVDDGALGAVIVNYTVPAPGALALLGLSGLAAMRRRR